MERESGKGRYKEVNTEVEDREQRRGEQKGEEKGGESLLSL